MTPPPAATLPGSILFDLDGTLIDSVPDVCASLNRVFAEEGLPLLEEDATKSLVGHGAMVLIEMALSAKGEDPERAGVRARDLHPRFLESYRAHPIDNTEIFPGVIEALEALGEAGVPMAICTNKPRKTAEPVLEALDLGKYFQAVCCGDVPHRKPDPRHVFETLESINSPAASTVFVGDSETDMAAARNARIPVIAVSFGYRNCTAEELDADVLIHSFHGLMDALDELSQNRA